MQLPFRCESGTLLPDERPSSGVPAEGTTTQARAVHRPQLTVQAAPEPALPDTARYVTLLRFPPYPLLHTRRYTTGQTGCGPL